MGEVSGPCSDRCCGTCLFWYDIFKGPDDVEVSGKCHGGPPSIYTDRGGKWPTTQRLEDCGAWKPRRALHEDEIQFARLLTQIFAHGHIPTDWFEKICDNLQLSSNEVFQVFHRARRLWLKFKEERPDMCPEEGPDAGTQ